LLVSDFFAKGVRNHPQAIAIADESVTFTFAYAEIRIATIARQLASLGVRRGDRVAMFARNSAGAYLAVLAIWRSGACYVSLNTRSTSAENAEMASIASCDIILCPIAAHADASQIGALMPNTPRLVGFDKTGQLCDCPAPGIDDDQGPSGNDLAWIVFTGGTTGRPKGVMLTHDALSMMTLAMQAHLTLPPEPLYIVAAPMTHAAGSLIPAVMGLGGCARFLAEANPRAIATAASEYEADVLFLPPTLIYMLLALPDLSEFNFSSLSHFVYAAAPMAEDKLVEAMGVFGPVMTQMYGQSEFPMMITYMSPEDHSHALAGPRERLSSCGRETMVAEIRITDAAGREVPLGEIGELEVRGALAMIGYIGGPRPKYDWIKTGDIGRRDADGFVYLLDRQKDMIITGGFNVYSVEVENVILAHPAVAQCAVIGVPDVKWGEAVKAVLELKPGGRIEPAEVIALCKQSLGSVKAPKSVEIWSTLPRNALGKVLKRDIRDRFWGDVRRQI
jgi:acyl-CoA synthetase (AMP-forming)/AMP-acid ligase II